MDAGASTPTVIPPERRPLEVDHAPAIPSPLNPAAAKAPKAPVREREQREKKESLKKREASGNSRGSTPDVKGKKGKGPVVPSPMRYSIPEPKTHDYDPPKDPILTSHEPLPFLTPDGRVELKKPIDQWVVMLKRNFISTNTPQRREQEGIQIQSLCSRSSLPPQTILSPI